MLHRRTPHRLLLPPSTRNALPSPPSVRLHLPQRSVAHNARVSPTPRMTTSSSPSMQASTFTSVARQSAPAQVPPSSSSSPHHAPLLSRGQIARLQKYSACDISDALLKLNVPGAGFIPDLVAYSPAHHPSPGSPSDANAAPSVSVAPISTVVFAPKSGPGATIPNDIQLPADDVLPAKNIPSNAHWADLTEPGTFVLLKQPRGQANAICGGIMALRMKVRQVSGIVVLGRLRDVDELRSTGLPIWGLGTSTVGSGGATVPWATQVPIRFHQVVLHPGDIAFHDPANGIVFIPRDKVDAVLDILPALVAADARVKEDVLNGISVHDAFKLHRS